MKFDTGDFREICLENPNLVKIGQKYRALYMEIKVCFTVAGDIKSP
jgi:hypothetical protein